MSDIHPQKPAPTGFESSGEGANTSRAAANDSTSTENPWTTKKQIVRERRVTKAKVEDLITKGYLFPIRMCDGGYFRKNQRIYWVFWRADVEAGIYAHDHDLPPPPPTYEPRPQINWEA